MEELLLEPAEEPLGGRVVRTAALRAHRPRQAVALADADPFVPPAVASMVRVDDRRLAGLERGARGLEHPVGQCGVGARADRPGGRHAVVAVDDRRQVHLARRDPELGDVRDPQLVRVRGVEVSVHEIGGRAADLALVHGPERAVVRAARDADLAFEPVGDRAAPDTAFAGRELVDPRGQQRLARIPQPADRAARPPPVRQIMVHRGALLLHRVARIPLPTTRRHPRPLLLEPVAMPHAQRLPTGITQLAEHIRSATLVFPRTTRPRAASAPSYTSP